MQRSIPTLSAGALSFACGGAVLLLAAPAQAHTGIGTTSGLAAGLLHPLFGLDHLLAMVAIGLLAVQRGGRALWAVPACFVGAMIGASAIGIAGLALPLVEFGIAVSAIVLGTAIALRQTVPNGLAMALAAGFALFHGHAHGAEIPPAASALIYGAGFVAATVALHGAGIGIGLAARCAAPRLAGTGMRLGGGAIALAGLAVATL
ncbi:MAG: HupE/UreJ family protein [Alphaproteobacteria bacterium]|jgi:urease accessory protein